jgi:hypothetical protein
MGSGSASILGNGLLPSASKMKWCAEFASPYDSTGGKYGTPETPHVQDFTLTYLLPSPRQLERRMIDF